MSRLALLHGRGVWGCKAIAKSMTQLLWSNFKLKMVDRLSRKENMNSTYLFSMELCKKDPHILFKNHSCYNKDQ